MERVRVTHQRATRRDPRMNQEQLLASWRQFKSRTASKRLVEPYSAEYEYQGPQFGHPSTYAFVRFDCQPAEHLSFEMGAAWPGHLGRDYTVRLEDAMGAAITDLLVASSEHPLLGCSLKCVEVRWNDIGSSEIAFYRATSIAMAKLRDEGSWSFRTARGSS